MKTVSFSAVTFLLGVIAGNLFVSTSRDNVTYFKSNEGVNVTPAYVDALEGVAISANNLLDSYEMDMPQTILVENMETLEYKDLQFYNHIVDSIWCEESPYKFGN